MYVVCMYAHVYVFFVCLYTYVVSIYVWKHVYSYMYVCTCVCVCIYVCIHVCMHACIYTYIHIYLYIIYIIYEYIGKINNVYFYKYMLVKYLINNKGTIILYIWKKFIMQLCAACVCMCLCVMYNGFIFHTINAINWNKVFFGFPFKTSRWLSQIFF